jgi:hypothetical protein
MLILVIASSCALPNINNRKDVNRRSSRFENCIVKMMREGVKQDLLTAICIEAHGDIK